MFCAVFRPVAATWGSVESELGLGCAAADPVEAHIHLFGLLGGDGIIGDSNGSVVVGLYVRFGLWPTHLHEGLAKRNHFLGSDEQISEFSFSCGGHDKFYDLSNGENGVVESRLGIICGEKYLGAGVAEGTSFIEESGIYVAGKYHASGAISDSAVGVYGNVAEKLVDCIGSVFGGGRLLGADGNECNEKFVVEGAAIPE